MLWAAPMRVRGMNLVLLSSRTLTDTHCVSTYCPRQQCSPNGPQHSNYPKAYANVTAQVMQLKMLALYVNPSSSMHIKVLQNSCTSANHAATCFKAYADT